MSKWPNLAELTLRGGGLTLDGATQIAESMPNLKALRVDGSAWLRPDGVRILNGLEDLEALGVSDTGLTPENIRDIPWNPKLKELRLRGPALDLATLEPVLNRLPLLTFLSFTAFAREPRGLQSFLECQPLLERLELEFLDRPRFGYSPETDGHTAGTPRTSNLKALLVSEADFDRGAIPGLLSLAHGMTELSLFSCDLPEEDWASIHAPKPLQELRIEFCRLDIVPLIRALPGLKTLILRKYWVDHDSIATEIASALPNLERLVLAPTQLSDAEIETLSARVRNLRYIDIESTHVTEGCASAMRKNLSGLDSVRIFKIRSVQDLVCHRFDLPAWLR